MLLPSERHTEADLAWWAEAEQGDRTHGETMMRRGRPAACETIRAFAAERCYLATSWGKDSVVACHLAVAAGVQVPLVHIRQKGSQRDPYQDDVRDAFLARFAVNYHEIIVEPIAKAQKDTRHAPALDVGIREAQRRFGRRWIGGLRADESGVRKIRARIGTADSCWPLKWWTAQDVFGYLAVNELPVHPAYGMTGGGRWPRDKIRVSIIGGAKGQQFGRREWELEYYGDVIRKIERSG